MSSLVKSKFETWLPNFFLRGRYSSLVVSDAYLGYKHVYSVLVVANKGIFKFINTVEVKNTQFVIQNFYLLFGKNGYFAVTIFE